MKSILNAPAAEQVLYVGTAESNHESAAGGQPNCTGAAAAGADHCFTYSDRSYQSTNLLCVFLVRNLAVSVANTKIQQQIHHCILIKGRLRE